MCPGPAWRSLPEFPGPVTLNQSLKPVSAPFFKNLHWLFSETMEREKNTKTHGSSHEHLWQPKYWNRKDVTAKKRCYMVLPQTLLYLISTMQSFKSYKLALEGNFFTVNSTHSQKMWSFRFHKILKQKLPALAESFAKAFEKVSTGRNVRPFLHLFIYTIGRFGL